MLPPTATTDQDYNTTMKTRTASIKETGEELSQADWARFDAAVAEEKAKRTPPGPRKPAEAEAGERDTSVRAEEE